MYHCLALGFIKMIEGKSGFSVAFEQCSSTRISCATQDSKKHEY